MHPKKPSISALSSALGATPRTVACWSAVAAREYWDRLSVEQEGLGLEEDEVREDGTAWRARRLTSATEVAANVGEAVDHRQPDGREPTGLEPAIPDHQD